MRVEQLPSPLVAWSLRHHGLVSLEAWRSFGRSERAFYRAIHSGRLVALLPRVAALPGRTIGVIERISAGVLSFGPDVVVSHRSGTFLWDVDIEGAAPVDLITWRRNPRTIEPGYRIHRPRDAAGPRFALHRGLPVTTPARTLLDLGAVAPGAVPDALEAMLAKGLVTARSVAHALERHRRPGRAGVTALANALADLPLSVPDSVLESAMARVFAEAGLGGWRFHAVVEGFEVDFCFAAEKLIVEVDGWTWHGADRARWEDDRARDMILTAAGWLVVRVTWRMVTRQPGLVDARLRATLAHRRVAG